MSKVTITQHKLQWSFPRDRFVEYEACDECWCRPLGIGKEVETLETLELECAAVFPCSDGTIEIVPSSVPTY